MLRSSHHRESNIRQNSSESSGLKRMIWEEIWRLISFCQNCIIAVPQTRVKTPETLASEQNPLVVTSCLSVYANIAHFLLIFIQINREGTSREVPTEDTTKIVSDPSGSDKTQKELKKVGCSVVSGHNIGVLPRIKKSLTQIQICL